MTEKKIIRELKRELALKRQFEKRLKPEKGYEKLIEVFIRDVARRELYPNGDCFFLHDNISSCFKIEIKGLYSNGIELWSGASDEIIFDEKQKKWRFAESNEENKIDGIRVLRIPFENIIKIDWEGDEYYRMPHIFCNFKYDGRPYESALYYIPSKSDNMTFYLPVEGISPLQKITQKTTKI